MIETMELHEKAMLASAKKGFTAATDVADYLAKKGMPFREAHEVVGNLVLYCEKNGKELEELSFDELHDVCPLFEKDVVPLSTPRPSLPRVRRTEERGHSAVKLQMEEAHEFLASMKAAYASEKG